MTEPYDFPQSRRPFHQRAVRSLIARVRVLFVGNRIWHVITDAMFLAFAYWFAFYVRFDSGTPAFYERAMFETIGVVVLLKVMTLVLFGIYNKWWRYISVSDMENVIAAVVTGSGLSFAYLFFLSPIEGAGIPRSVLIYDLLFSALLIAGIRFIIRSIYERPHLLKRGRSRSGAGVIIIGAGEAGKAMLREIIRKDLPLRPLGLIDDDPRKQHMRLENIPVVGTSDDLQKILRSAMPDEVVIAMPSATGEVLQDISAICRQEGVPVRTLPALHELVSGSFSNLTAQLREVQVEDVLGREPVSVDLARISGYLSDRVVMVTGAAGSIGSELCRQIARLNPSQLVLVDHGENALFLFHNELVNEHGFPDCMPVVADVKNRARMDAVMQTFKPSVVFHAGAYKHVSMMEYNPTEAVANNAMGTQVLCELAVQHNVERFLLVSTDKAVEPKTVMGQSKALAEMTIRSYAATTEGTRFMAVRFGNVLGSNGSVVPIFKEQIARGGPVTVTHPDMTRFFMTIPEAVQLIVQAGSMGKGGEVFVLDMGKPVRIMDLAHNIIELSGKIPGEDIAIEVVGARPGEKLHEVLFAGDENVDFTEHAKIWRARCSATFDPIEFQARFAELKAIMSTATPAQVADKLTDMLSERIAAGALDPSDHPDSSDTIASTLS